MRRSGLLWWFGALALALAAGGLTFRVLTAAVPQRVAAEGEAMRGVVVAAVDIPARRTITAADVTIRDLPVAAIPEGAAISLEQVEGKMAVVDLFAGAPIMLPQLTTPDIVTRDLALSIPEGKTIIAVPTRSSLISARLVRPGDRVDLLATFEIQGIENNQQRTWFESVALLQNLEVHAIILPGGQLPTEGKQGLAGLGGKNEADAAAAEEAPRGGVFSTTTVDEPSILLAVESQDALTIRHVLDIGGVLDIALRAVGDGSLAVTEPVDQPYLATRYNIRVKR
jgi:pilus assembly protein CpaB